MTTLSEMVLKVSNNSEYDKMIRFVRPMCDYFNLNQFYFLRIQSHNNQEYFFSIGTNLRWHEYVFDDIGMVSRWPIVRHPDKLTSQISLLKNTADVKFKEHLELAWNKFNINFTINIQRKIPGGIEACGFGLNSLHPKAEEHVLNEIPLLFKFIDCFCMENKRLIDLACEYQVEISSLVGSSFYETPSVPLTSSKREKLLKQLGLSAGLSLTQREIEILKFLAYGYPAKYIAKKLHLSNRTVENYTAAIKSKLDCNSRVDLINKARYIVPFHSMYHNPFD